MPKKFIPYYPDTIEGQAILNNVTRTKRILKYRDSDKVYERIKRGLPLYDVELLEHVGNNVIASEAKQSQNLVIHGECISACAYLKQQEIKVDLVYIDPPFASGADYAKKVFIRKNPQLAKEIQKAEETLDIDELRSFEEKMYGDIWNKEDYLNWIYENLIAIKAVMSETATIYLHLDWHIGSYVKILLDEIFGEDNFLNEIIWCYSSMQKSKNNWNRKHDNIYVFTKSDSWIFNSKEVLEKYDEDYVTRFKYEDETGKYMIRGKGGSESPIHSQGDLTPEHEIKYPNWTYRQYLSTGALPLDWWQIDFLNSNSSEKLDYSTQKPEVLIERIVKGSSDNNMIIADFFGGSGVTAKVANDLGRNFIHVDVGINSIQTTRDRLKTAGAEFDVLEVKDGVNLFRNPIQTMDKLAKLIPGLQKNKKYNTPVIPNDSEESLSKFWFGSISDSKLGQIPVYVPNLLDHNQKVLDIPIINEIISQELPKLENIKKVIAYYIDLSDEKTIKNFIDDNNATEIEVELKDLKQILDEVVVTDQVEYTCHSESASAGKESLHSIEITKFISDRLIQKIDEYNQKKELASTKTKLIEETENGNGDSEESENTEEENGSTNGNGNKKPFKKIEISENGLELIELISLDCKNSTGKWHSTTEIKIDKYGYVILNGAKTKTFWDCKIQSTQKPLRMKIRNIAGDEIIVNIEESKKTVQAVTKIKKIGKTKIAQKSMSKQKLKKDLIIKDKKKLSTKSIKKKSSVKKK